ncbi:MAG: hypothetical protein SOV27_04725, partial [Eubacteriales bacterium]|nr:hypothetical protein [Eubacteriales bacterium]
KNLTISASSVDNVGGVVGLSTKSVIAYQIQESTILGRYFVGGVAGRVRVADDDNEFVIKESTTVDGVTTVDYAVADSYTIINQYGINGVVGTAGGVLDTNVSGKNFVGGIVGVGAINAIREVYVYGGKVTSTLSSDTTYAGGAVGVGQILSKDKKEIGVIGVQISSTGYVGGALGIGISNYKTNGKNKILVTNAEVNDQIVAESVGVSSIKISSGKYIGGIVGTVTKGYATINQCSIRDSELTSNKGVTGGIIAKVKHAHLSLLDNAVSGSAQMQLIQNKKAKPEMIISSDIYGGLVGVLDDSTMGDKNTESDKYRTNYKGNVIRTVVFDSGTSKGMIVGQLINNSVLSNIKTDTADYAILLKSGQVGLIAGTVDKSRIIGCVSKAKYYYGTDYAYNNNTKEISSQSSGVSNIGGISYELVNGGKILSSINNSTIIGSNNLAGISVTMDNSRTTTISKYTDSDYKLSDDIKKEETTFEFDGSEKKSEKVTALTTNKASIISQSGTSAGIVSKAVKSKTYNTNSVLSYSKNEGVISAISGSSLGGIIAYADYVSISNVINTGAINGGTTSNIGGIMGQTTNTSPYIDSSVSLSGYILNHSKDNVTTNASNVGGIAGIVCINVADKDNIPYISVDVSDILGDSHVGAVFGKISTASTDTKANQKVVVHFEKLTARTQAGGYAGLASSEKQNQSIEFKNTSDFSSKSSGTIYNVNMDNVKPETAEKVNVLDKTLYLDKSISDKGLDYVGVATSKGDLKYNNFADYVGLVLSNKMMGDATEANGKVTQKNKDIGNYIDHWGSYHNGQSLAIKEKMVHYDYKTSGGDVPSATSFGKCRGNSPSYMLDDLPDIVLVVNTEKTKTAKVTYNYNKAIDYYTTFNQYTYEKWDDLAMITLTFRVVERTYVLNTNNNSTDVSTHKLEYTDKEIAELKYVLKTKEGSLIASLEASRKNNNGNVLKDQSVPLIDSYVDRLLSNKDSLLNITDADINEWGKNNGFGAPMSDATYEGDELNAVLRAFGMNNVQGNNVLGEYRLADDGKSKGYNFVGSKLQVRARKEFETKVGEKTFDYNDPRVVPVTVDTKHIFGAVVSMVENNDIDAWINLQNNITFNSYVLKNIYNVTTASINEDQQLSTHNFFTYGSNNATNPLCHGYMVSGSIKRL